MSKNLKFQAFKQKALKDPVFIKAYEELEDEYVVLDKLITARKAMRLTQQDLAVPQKS